MSNRRRTTPTTRWIVVFVALVLISGYGFQASGYFDNPVSEIKNTLALSGMMVGGNGLPGLPNSAVANSGSSGLPAQANTTTSSGLPVLANTTTSSSGQTDLQSLAAANGTPINTGELDDEGEHEHGFFGGGEHEDGEGLARIAAPSGQTRQRGSFNNADDEEGGLFNNNTTAPLDNTLGSSSNTAANNSLDSSSNTAASNTLGSSNTLDSSSNTAASNTPISLNTVLASDSATSGQPVSLNSLPTGSSALGTNGFTLAPSDNGMEWSHFGEVLFDIWFLFAASAVFIIIQQLYGFIKNTVQHVTA